MMNKLLDFFRKPWGFNIGIKRRNENPEDEDVNEQPRKQRKIEIPEVKSLFTSDQFVRPSANWKMPRKRPMIDCRRRLQQQQQQLQQQQLQQQQQQLQQQQLQQQQQHIDASQPQVHRTAPQPGCSWFEACNVIEVADDEDTDVFGVWQDANTLRERPIFRAADRTKKTGATIVDLSADDDDDTCANDIEVIKVVESHSSEIARSGNTISIFQTPSGRVPALSRHFATGSDSVKKSEGVMQPLKSASLSSSEDGTGTHSGTLYTTSRTEEKSNLALYESIKLEEKRQYLELLQKFTEVPLQAQNRHPRSIWNTSRTVSQEGKRLRSFDYAGSAREKLHPTFIDLTKPERCRSLSRNRIEVCRDREAEPSTSASKQKEDLSASRIFPFTRTNSLATSLQGNIFCKEDFVAGINEKYRRKQEAREREEEEIKLKVSHFKEREKKLHEEALERMTNYLKITDAILDESYIKEEEVVLPELTAEMQSIIDAALIPRPPNEVLVESFGLSIKRHDMHTLADLNWLNDEVINFYMELLKERGKLENYPSVYTFNTFFYPRLLSGGHAALKRWTRKVDIFCHDLIIVPVHLGVHWCLAAIDFRNKSISYYDSMGSPNKKCLQSLLKYLQDESLDKKKKPFNTSDWQTENVQEIPQQMNGSDCGMFACTFAEFICRGADITFTQADMPYLRQKMVYEICQSKLLM